MLSKDNTTILTRGQKISLTKKGKRLSLSHRKKLSEAKKGKSYKEIGRPSITEETKGKISKALKGNDNGKYRKKRKHTEETKKKMSKAKKGCIPWNKGKGKYSYWERVKRSKKWKDMRKKVFERDNYTCQMCGKRGKELHPDHIKPKIIYPELAFDLNNIRTLCKECHRKTDTYGCKVRLLKKERKYAY